MSAPESNPEIDTRSASEALPIAVFSAWPYANGPRHVGHAASLLPGDVTARYHRMKGDNVMFVSGTDEYGTPNVIAADKAGIPTSEYVDQVSGQIRNDFIDLGMSFDNFTRTTSPVHQEVAQDLFVQLESNGYLAQGTMPGAFDAETNQALPDRFVEGGCPHCGAGARGDQCDSCTQLLEPFELVNPVSSITGNAVDFRETTHYFLELDKLAPDVTAWVGDEGNVLSKPARAESLASASELRPRAVTRDMTWGIPLPEGYELEGQNDPKVLYVWFEAVMGYLSASVELARNRGEPDSWKDWWKNQDAIHTYAMGKDNVPFHAVMWPAILAGTHQRLEHPAAGDQVTQPITEYTDLHQPDVLASTGYLLFGDKKLSSSRGNVVYVTDLVEAVGQDVARFHLISAGPTDTKDANFTIPGLVENTNRNLSNRWGNLVSRAVSMAVRNCDGIVPDVDLDETDKGLIESVGETFDTVGTFIEAGRANRGLHAAMETVSEVNGYLNAQEPWKKFDSGDLTDGKKAIRTTLTAIDGLSHVLAPYLPKSSNEIHHILGYETDITEQPELGLAASGHEIITGKYSRVPRWEMPDLPVGQALAPPKAHLFPRLKEEDISRILGIE